MPGVAAPPRSWTATRAPSHAPDALRALWRACAAPEPPSRGRRRDRSRRPGDGQHASAHAALSRLAHRIVDHPHVSVDGNAVGDESARMHACVLEAQACRRPLDRPRRGSTCMSAPMSGPARMLGLVVLRVVLAVARPARAGTDRTEDAVRDTDAGHGPARASCWCGRTGGAGAPTLVAFAAGRGPSATTASSAAWPGCSGRSGCPGRPRLPGSPRPCAFRKSERPRPLTAPDPQR